GEHGEPICRYLTVASIGRDNIDFAVGCGPVHEFRLHLTLRAEIQAIGGPQCRPFRSREYFIVAGNSEFPGARGKISDRADVHPLALLSLHSQGVSVLESE